MTPTLTNAEKRFAEFFASPRGLVVVDLVKLPNPNPLNFQFDNLWDENLRLKLTHKLKDAYQDGILSWPSSPKEKVGVEKDSGE